MAKKLIKENPALFCGQARLDLERVYAIDEATGTRYNIVDKSSENANEYGEVLVPYPNEIEWEITNHKTQLPK